MWQAEFRCCLEAPGARMLPSEGRRPGAGVVLNTRGGDPFGGLLASSARAWLRGYQQHIVVQAARESDQRLRRSRSSRAAH